MHLLWLSIGVWGFAFLCSFTLLLVVPVHEVTSRMWSWPGLLVLRGEMSLGLARSCSGGKRRVVAVMMGAATSAIL